MTHRVGCLTFLFTFVVMVTSQEDVTKTLDLAEQAFDDQYLGCKRGMEQKLKEQNVLATENEQNRKLRRAWKNAENIWAIKKSDLKSKLPPGFEDYHGIALMTYTSFIRNDFNNAVRSTGKSYQSYMDDFGFKWLHFYVTSALQLLQKSELYGEYKVYIGIGDDLEIPPNGNIYIKFGHFFYASLAMEEAEFVGNKSLLIIDKYPGVKIEIFSEFGNEQEVLVPGYEVFSLSPMEEDGLFKLNTTRKFCSNFNCAYIKGRGSELSVQDCINGSVSSSRMCGLVTLLLLVTFLSHIL